MKLTGLSSFGAGVILVGAARLMMMSEMFLLFSRVSGSPRVAGIGTAIFAGNFNFLFFSAQYSYESLALPLLGRAADRRRARRSPRAAPAPGDRCRDRYHRDRHDPPRHLLCAGRSWPRCRSLPAPPRTWRWANPWRLALFAAALAAAWLLLVASSTLGYLAPVLGDAIKSAVHTLFGEESSRGLFQGERPPGEATPTGRAASPCSRRRPARDRHALRPAPDLAPPPQKPAGGALRDRRPRLLRHPGAALHPGGLGDGEPGQRVPLHRPRLRRVAGFGLETRRSRPALAPRARQLRVASRPRRRRDLRLALGIQLASPLKIKAEGRTITSPTLSLAEWAGGTSANARFAASPATRGCSWSPASPTAFAGHRRHSKSSSTPSLARWEVPLLRHATSATSSPTAAKSPTTRSAATTSRCRRLRNPLPEPTRPSSATFPAPRGSTTAADRRLRSRRADRGARAGAKPQ